MAFVAVDENGQGFIYEGKPERTKDIWMVHEGSEGYVPISKGAVFRLTGAYMTWDNEPVEV